MLRLFRRRRQKKRRSRKDLDSPSANHPENTAVEYKTKRHRHRHLSRTTKRLKHFFQKPFQKKLRNRNQHSSDASSNHSVTHIVSCSGSCAAIEQGVAHSLHSPKLTLVPRVLDFHDTQSKLVVPDSPLSLSLPIPLQKQMSQQPSFSKTRLERTIIFLLLSLVLHALWLRQKYSTKRQAVKQKDSEVGAFESIPMLTSIYSKNRPGNSKDRTQTIAEDEESSCASSDMTNDDESILVLQKRCNQLTALTKMLSSKLVDQTLQTEEERKRKHHKIAKYQNMILKLEHEHRLECSQRNHHLRELECQLHRKLLETTIPTSPRSCETRALVRFDPHRAAMIQELNKQAENQRAKRSRYIICPREVQAATAILCSPSSSTKCTTFSMASSIIQENQFFPAMLSALVLRHQQQQHS